MSVQEIAGDDYTIKYDPEAVIVNFYGELALGGPKDYQPITDFLNEIADSEPQKITLDVRELNFLNSSGISMLSKFVISFRRKENINLTVLGSNEVPWQGKSLSNLKKLLPSLELITD
ncbi:conserved hypothetical protein [Rippkaea orientalis PCC 8801]|uniref:STAS domain-containing protein n=1 Tax=Rippkaea orientalis (strain PCC 8801 / RF-1) TaxID=41431 RepID=B7JYK9_RIPO1|nr:hypothetical protein [Rippkaea orientalis]ACK64879.1 conserved hypothetical protein [Rippkaea orientalis PCC 8801]